MEQEFDLHIHTKFSDGQDSIPEVIEKIKKTNIKVFAITDHDSVQSVAEVKKCDIGNLSYIKGIEVSSILDDKYKIHILGYFIDENNQDLINMTDLLKKARRQRFIELYEQINKSYNIVIPMEEIEDVANNENVPGKPHLAKLMLKHNYVSSVKEAFDKYLEDVKTKTSNRYPADKVIKIIHDAGGIAIWAHPRKAEKKYSIDFKELMPRLLELGLNGIEPFNTLHSFDDALRFYKYAKANNLVISGGSDYHGPAVKPNAKLGVVYNSDENKIVEKELINIIEKGDVYNG